MEPPPSAPGPNGSVARYALGVAITVAAILSQYVVPRVWPASVAVYGNLPGDLAVVYGLPVVAFALLVGARPLRAWKVRLGRATVEGLGWYAAMALLGLLVAFVLLLVYAAVDPGAIRLLERENPALREAAADPWFYVAFSFVVGAFEETIFRGWIFGFWRDRASGWLGPAVGSSAVFAGVHLYYGLTYGPISPVPYSGLFLLGFAFAATYHVSGGNLVVPAILHGVNDATAFLSVSPWPALGYATHYGFIAVAGIVGLVAWLGRGYGSAAGPPGPRFP